jgi:hypothetical protein
VSVSGGTSLSPLSLLLSSRLQAISFATAFFCTILFLLSVVLDDSHTQTGTKHRFNQPFNNFRTFGAAHATALSLGCSRAGVG